MPLTRAKIKEIAEYSSPTNVSFYIGEVQRMLRAEGYAIAKIAPTRAMVKSGDEVMYGRYGCSFEVTPIYSAMLEAEEDD